MDSPAPINSGPMSLAPTTSVIIPCCNGRAFTRACLDTVVRHTRSGYELVIVDNGSTDGTSVFLAEFARQHHDLRITTIHNEHNRGFPAACNQGLAAARGEYLLFLNNDTLVTEGWLDGLRAALESGPHLGLAGPVSNYAAGPQLVRVRLSAPAEVDALASRRREEFAGQRVPVRRLTSVCLLVRREVFQRIGGWDERFGLGFYDDDDLCVRAEQAGFGLVIAQDVYIHHFGSQTFKALGLDVRRQLTDSAALFRTKWATQENVASAREPQPASSESPQRSQGTRRPRVSLCMIVKNEEAHLGACLASVAGLADETIVVDTGSTDRTRVIAQEHGARLFDFPWIDDFAAARNESLRHATGDWLFLLDADDRVDGENYARLRSLFGRLGEENVAYVMKVRSATSPTGHAVRLLDQVRLLRLHPSLHWEYRIHEQIVPSFARCGGTLRWTDIVIDHTGYQDPTCRRRKLERNLRLLQREQQERPDDPFTLFNLGRTYLDLGCVAEGVAQCRRSLEKSPPFLSIVRKLYPLLASGYLELGEADRALEMCREGLQRYPDDAELLYRQGVLLRRQGLLAEAEASFRRLLSSQPTAQFDMLDAGIRGPKAHHQLGLVLSALGRLDEARAAWRRVVQEQPGFTAGWLGLAETALTQRQWDELAEAIGGLERSGGDDVRASATLLRARGALVRRELGTARDLLEPLCAARPTAVPPRVLLSQALLEQASDWGRAEAVLREILALDPGHADAQHNLAILLCRQADRPLR